jgi:hypothetical protein
MAAQQQAPDKPADKPRPVEELAKELRTPAWQAAGLMEEKGWAWGKVMTMAEFKAALAMWLKSAMCGKKDFKKG